MRTAEEWVRFVAPAAQQSPSQTREERNVAMATVIASIQRDALDDPDKEISVTDWTPLREALAARLPDAFNPWNLEHVRLLADALGVTEFYVTPLAIRQRNGEPHPMRWSFVWSTKHRHQMNYVASPFDDEMKMHQDVVHGAFAGLLACVLRGEW